MRQTLRLSIVIPAKNEERRLPRLLEAMGSQTLAPHEVIVADAGSTDRTREIAERAGCRVVPGGLPAAGRNAGARVARGNWIVFLDSDVLVGPAFLEGLERQIRTRRLECGTVYNIPRYEPGEKGYHSASVRAFDSFVYFIHNAGLKLSAAIRYPYATGTCMFISRDLFGRTHGFDERVRAFEDSELAARTARIAKYGVVKQPAVYISTRRFDKHNRLVWVIYLVIDGFVGRAIVGEKSRVDYFSDTAIPRLP